MRSKASRAALSASRRNELYALCGSLRCSEIQLGLTHGLQLTNWELRTSAATSFDDTTRNTVDMKAAIALAGGILLLRV